MEALNFSRSLAAALFAATLPAFLPTGLSAQNGGAEAAGFSWFPAAGYFSDPVADPREPRFGIGLIRTDLFAENGSPDERPPFAFGDPADMAVDVQAVASVGGTLPLWRVAQWDDGGLMIGAQAGVFARFRIEEPSRDAVGTDWLVALPVEAAYGPYAWRLRVLHRSAHLGDELIGDTGARRIEFGHEAVDLLVTRRIGRMARVYAGGAFIFRSNTESQTVLAVIERDDAAALQAGVEFERYPWHRERMGFFAAFDWRSAQRTGWRSAISAVAGFTVRGRDRSARLVARYFNGPSPAGEFFLTHESFWGIELMIAP